jgi:hypothetical protein
VRSDSTEALAALGVAWEDLVRPPGDAAGVTLQHVRRMGAARLAQAAGLTLAKLRPLLGQRNMLAQLRAHAPTFEDLYALEASVSALRELGLTRENMAGLGLTGAQWALLGMNPRQIKLLGLTADDVRRLGWTTRELREHMQADDATLERLGRGFVF